MNFLQTMLAQNPRSGRLVTIIRAFGATHLTALRFNRKAKLG
jgi:hypothetical protein